MNINDIDHKYDDAFFKEIAEYVGGQYSVKKWKDVYYFVADPDFSPIENRQVQVKLIEKDDDDGILSKKEKQLLGRWRDESNALIRRTILSFQRGETFENIKDRINKSQNWPFATLTKEPNEVRAALKRVYRGRWTSFDGEDFARGQTLLVMFLLQIDRVV